MTPEEQERFAAVMRAHIPKPEGAKWHPLYFITEAAQRVLGRPVMHWRDLSLKDAQKVARAVKKTA